METQNEMKGVKRVSSAILAIFVALTLFLFVPLATGNMAVTQATSTTPTPATPAVDQTKGDKDGEIDACEPKFVQVASNNEGNRVIGDFSVRYAAAMAKAQADAGNMGEAQLELVLEESAKDALVLASFSHAFGLYEDPNNWASELVEDECLSAEGQKLHAQLEGALSAEGVTFSEALAPRNGINSGVHDGVYGVSPHSGITGDRTSIKVDMGKKGVVYILVRCANPVYPEKPNIPEVPTDEKDPAKDPGPRGNAPIGEGPNADPGPGKYIAPENMEQPPAAPRVNPVTPAPELPAPRPSTPSNPAVPTPDPAPAPAPEPSAPPPTNPVGPSDPGGGCIVIPGVEDCS